MDRLPVQRRQEGLYHTRNRPNNDEIDGIDAQEELFEEDNAVTGSKSTHRRHRRRLMTMTSLLSSLLSLRP